MLTEKQETVVGAIRVHWAKYGCSPSIRDLCDALDIGSPNGVMGHLRALVKKGAVELGGEKTARQIWTAGLRDAIRRLAGKAK